MVGVCGEEGAEIITCDWIVEFHPTLIPLFCGCHIGWSRHSKVVHRAEIGCGSAVSATRTLFKKLHSEVDILWNAETDKVNHTKVEPSRTRPRRGCELVPVTRTSEVERNPNASLIKIANLVLRIRITLLCSLLV